jgi:hypothetical protein
MTHTFVPLSQSTKPAAPRLELAPRISPATDLSAAQPFRPFAASLSPVPCSGQTTGEPKVNLIREGDRITRITVECPCGHTVELSCVY